MKVSALILPLFVAILATATSYADKMKVGIGSDSPPFKVGTWIKGEKIAKLDPDKIYIVEFWATWCGACVENIPRLTDLAHRFKDKVSVIGITSGELGEPAVQEMVVSRLVSKLGEKMDYTVAIDTPDRFMNQQWMDAAGQNAIPTAFIIFKGKIVWIGTDTDQLTGILADVIGKNYLDADALKYTEAQKAVEPLYELRDQVIAAGFMSTESEAKLQKKSDDFEALDRQVGLAKRLYKTRFDTDVNGKFNAKMFINQIKFVLYHNAVMSGKTGSEVTKLEASARAATNPADESIDGVKDEYLFKRYMDAVARKSNPVESKKLAEQLLEVKSADLLVKFANKILGESNSQHRDLNLALALAKKSVDASEGQWNSSYCLETYAQALAETGKFKGAIKYQQKALQACTNEERKERLKTKLQEYISCQKNMPDSLF